VNAISQAAESGSAIGVARIKEADYAG
jgi:hypothetical protein